MFVRERRRTGRVSAQTAGSRDSAVGSGPGLSRREPPPLTSTGAAGVSRISS